MVVVHGQDDHFHVRVELADLRQGGDAVHDGHLDVQEDHVGLHVLEEVEQLHAVVGLSDQFDVLFDGKRRFDAGPEEGVVIGDDYFDYFICGFGAFHDF